MKRNIALIISIVIIIMVVVSFKIIKYKSNYMDVKKYNATFLDYNRDNLHGIDITSVINKATNSNEKNKIKKDESNHYISNDYNSIIVFVKFEKEGSEYSMEKINKVGINEFTKYFGDLDFKCNTIKYHENGKISEMHFEATNY